MRRAGHKSLLVFCALPIDWFKVRVTPSVCPKVRVNQSGKPVRTAISLENSYRAAPGQEHPLDWR
jgi:hypothetical protein